jgi:Tol biopolymer transport system component
MAPDGRSFITAVGLRQSAVWVHDGGGDRQISLEGRAFDPKFLPDGKRLCYRTERPAELWVADLDSGHSEPILPGFPVTGRSQVYDLSRDGRRVVVASPDRSGKPRLWLAPLDRRSPPRQIPNVEGDQPLFGPEGEVFFRAPEGSSSFAYRVREDGTGLRKAADYPVYLMQGVSPDGRWLIARFEVPGEHVAVTTMAVPLAGGPPVRIAAYAVGEPVKWSADGRRIAIFGGGRMAGVTGQIFVLPVAAGGGLPVLPPGGFQTASDLANAPGVEVIPSVDGAPGPRPGVYAYSRATVQRNLYRIPIP